MPEDDEVGFADETWGLRTNHICSKDPVEYALPAETFVSFVVKKQYLSAFSAWSPRPSSVNYYSAAVSCMAAFSCLGIAIVPVLATFFMP
jgi:hypothetical protein